MKFIKKHKVALIVTGVILILLLLIFLGIKKAFFANISDSPYGNRLEGIENYPIEKSTISEIKTALEETELVNSTQYDLKGRIINFLIEVKEDADLEASRALADKISEKFTDEIKAFYDIQIFITCSDEENELYPTIGYKHKTSDEFVWNNN